MFLQKSDLFPTQVSIDMYGRVQGLPSNSPNSKGIMLTPASVEMGEYKDSSSYKHHFYQFGYSQHHTIYAAASDIYQVKFYFEVVFYNIFMEKN